MSIAKLDSLELAFLDEGEGVPVLLIHGFASTRQMNWVYPGWVKALTGAGYRVIAHDNRGHGQSSKFYQEDEYSLDLMANDTISLLDHLDISHCHLMGFSMGARISARLAHKWPERFTKIVFGGNGYGMVRGNGEWAPAVRDAMLAGRLDEVTDPRGNAFRTFAEQTKGDLKALAACIMGMRAATPESMFEEISQPVLVAVGTDDDVSGSPQKLTALLQNGKYLPIPGRDHMRSVGDKVYIKGVLEFLSD